MKYFLTGASGFIGGRVAEMLLADGHSVSAVVRNPDKSGSLAGKGVELHRGDITDRVSLRKPMRDADCVIHLAAWYKLGRRGSEDAAAINVEGTKNVLETMRQLEIPKGVYTSTLAVFSDTKGEIKDETFRHDGPWLSEYDRTKWAAHYQVALPMMQTGLPLIIVQPGVNYGPGDTSSIRSLMIQFLTRKLPILPLGTRYCWAHVDDTARGHILASQKGKPGESYIIAGPPHSVIEVMEIAEKITGIPAPKLRAAPGALKTMSLFAGLLERVVPLPESYSGEGLRVTAGATYLGTSAKAERELGFKARTLEEGLRETLDHEMQLLGMEGRSLPPPC